VIFGTSGHRGLAWGSVAALAIAPLQDALNLGKGADERSGPGRGQLALTLHGTDGGELRV
jgi:hypothetical protein